MRINSNYKVRKIASSYLVVCQGKVGADMTRVINLNSTSVELWKHFDSMDFELEDVSAYLISKYSIDPERASNDAAKWINALKDCGVIA